MSSTKAEQNLGLVLKKETAENGRQRNKKKLSSLAANFLTQIKIIPIVKMLKNEQKRRPSRELKMFVLTYITIIQNDCLFMSFSRKFVTIKSSKLKRENE